MLDTLLPKFTCVLFYEVKHLRIGGLHTTFGALNRTRKCFEHRLKLKLPKGAPRSAMLPPRAPKCRPRNTPVTRTTVRSPAAREGGGGVEPRLGEYPTLRAAGGRGAGATVTHGGPAGPGWFSPWAGRPHAIFRGRGPYLRLYFAKDDRRCLGCTHVQDFLGGKRVFYVQRYLQVLRYLGT